MPTEKEVKQLRNEINELRAEVENLKRMLDGFADVLRPRMANAGQGRLTRFFTKD